MDHDHCIGFDATGKLKQGSLGSVFEISPAHCRTDYGQYSSAQKYFRVLWNISQNCFLRYSITI